MKAPMQDKRGLYYMVVRELYGEIHYTPFTNSDAVEPPKCQQIGVYIVSPVTAGTRVSHLFPCVAGNGVVKCRIFELGVIVTGAEI